MRCVARWGLLLLVGTGCAKQSASVAAATGKTINVVPLDTQPAPETETADLLFWRVTKGDLTNHMLGTCHLPIPLEHAVTAEHLPALETARVLYTEVDMDALAPEDVLRALYNPENSFRELVGDVVFQQVGHKLRLQTPAPLLDMQAPWVTLNLLPMADLMADPEFVAKAAELGSRTLDKAVQAHAQNAGVEHVGLETIAFQLDMLDSLMGPDAIREAFSDPDGLTKQSGQTMALVNEACLKGDDSRVMEWLQPSDLSEQDKQALFQLLDQRNLNWMDTLGPAFETGNAFVAVGAGHMYGDNGLIQKMESLGWTVERLGGVRPVMADFPVPKLREGPLLPALEEPDPQALATLKAEFVTAADALCNAANPAVACMGGVDQCRAEVTSAADLCALQWASIDPAELSQLQPEVLQTRATCALSAPLFKSLLNGYPEEPACLAMEQAMMKAFGDAL